jgi:hypothetical protein
MKKGRVKVIERKLGRERVYGQAFQGLDELEIDPRQPPKEYLDTLIHETLHLAQPELDEKTVSDVATFITRVLWRQNYRRVSQ